MAQWLDCWPDCWEGGVQSSIPCQGEQGFDSSTNLGNHKKTYFLTFHPMLPNYSRVVDPINIPDYREGLLRSILFIFHIIAHDICAVCIYIKLSCMSEASLKKLVVHPIFIAKSSKKDLLQDAFLVLFVTEMQTMTSFFQKVVKSAQKSLFFIEAKMP